MAGNGSDSKKRKKNNTGQPEKVRLGTKSGGGAGGGSEGGSSPCDIQIDTDLEGVRADALAGLEVGAPLAVTLHPTSSFRVAVCVKPDATVVGSLSAFRSLTQLLECLEQGVAYRVEITAIGSGRCHVKGGRV